MKTQRSPAQLMQRFQQRNTTVCVVGLGYVGLPLARAAAQVGHLVIGVDTNRTRVDQINSGISYVEDIESGSIAPLVRAGALRATIDLAEARDSTVAIIAVPTPFDGARRPDLSYVSQAALGLATVMGKGSLVVLESTTYPGTTEEFVVEAFRAQGFLPGEDIYVAYSPERIDPGNDRWDLRNTPKVVAGFSLACRQVAIAFYSTFVETIVPVSDLRTAEMSKVFENTFRLVNISMVNEFREICDRFGIDVWEVLEACASKPYGFMRFSPGPGVGGHCIPVDPGYLSWKARELGVSTEFIDLATRVNDGMTRRIMSRITKRLNADRKSVNSARIGLLGVAYKKNSSDVREAPALRLIEALHEAGALVSYHDPHVPVIRCAGLEFRTHPLTPAYLDSLDCVVVLVDHDRIDWSLVRHHATSLLDTRNVTNQRVSSVPSF